MLLAPQESLSEFCSDIASDLRSDGLTGALERAEGQLLRVLSKQEDRRWTRLGAPAARRTSPSTRVTGFTKMRSSAGKNPDVGRSVRLAG